MTLQLQQVQMELLSPLNLVPTSILTSLQSFIDSLGHPFTSLIWLPCYAHLGYPGLGCAGLVYAHLVVLPLVTFHHCTASGHRHTSLGFLTGFTSFRLLPMFPLSNHPTRLREPPMASFCREQERTKFLSVAFETLHNLVEITYISCWWSQELRFISKQVRALINTPES